MFSEAKSLQLLTQCFPIWDSVPFQEEGLEFLYNENKLTKRSNYKDRWIISLAQSLIKFVRVEMQGIVKKYVYWFQIDIINEQNQVNIILILMHEYVCMSYLPYIIFFKKKKPMNIIMISWEYTLASSLKRFDFSEFTEKEIRFIVQWYWKKTCTGQAIISPMVCLYKNLPVFVF